MKKLFKGITIIIVLTMIFSVLTAGCGKSLDTAKNDTSSSSGAKTEPRIKLKMFMGNSGVPHPQGVDPSDNQFIKVIEDYANVDLEMEVPGYEDFQTKFNLMLSSNNLPDIVHTWYYNDILKSADAGAFIDLKKYYDQSATMKKVITPEMLEFAKSPSGKYYDMPMAWNSPQGWGNYARVDLLKKYNGGKWPESVEEWISYLRVIKEKIPNSIPISAHISTNSIFDYGQSLWLYYGVLPVGSRAQDGKVVADFTLPEYREALIMWTDLYKDGILDKEFATNDQPKRLNRVANNSVAILTDTAAELVPLSAQKRDGGSSLSTGFAEEDKEIAVCPPLKKYPSVLKDVKYTKYSYKTLPILKNSHGIWISSTSKYPDKAWKVIEGFASDELFNAIAYGKEGEQYTVKDGKKVFSMEKVADPTFSWGLQLGIIHGFPSISNSPSRLAEYENKIGSARFKTVSDSLQIWEKEAGENGLNWGNFTTPLDEVNKKSGDANAFIVEVATNVIMGKMSITEYDKKVEEYKKLYQWMWDERTKQYNELKTVFTKNGVKRLD